MTGRELIMYILENNLENEQVFDSTHFLTIDEAAVKYGVGPATIEVWIEYGWLYAFKIKDTVYIPKNAKFTFGEPKTTKE